MTGLKTLSCNDSLSVMGRVRTFVIVSTHLELTLGTSDRDGHVVTDDLGSDHREGLALSRVDLSRHDRRSRFILGKREFAQSTTRSRTEVTDIVRNLVERTSNHVQSSGSFDNRVVSSEGFELVRGSLERESSDFGDLGSDLDIEPFAGVESSSDGSSSLCELRETRENVLDTLDTVRNLLNVTRELLSESEGSRVLQVSATDLDDVVERLLLFEESGVELLEGRDEGVGDLDDGRDVHGSGEAIQGKQVRSRLFL